jgi:hypothetical protein
LPEEGVDDAEAILSEAEQQQQQQQQLLLQLQAVDAAAASTQESSEVRVVHEVMQRCCSISKGDVWFVCIT